MESDKRRWHVSKEIPVALIVSIACSLFLGGIAYQSIKADQSQLSRKQVELGEKLEKTDAKVDRLNDAIQNGSVPSALNARRLDEQERISAAIQARQSQQDSAMLQLAARVADNERRLSSESLRNRASRER